MAEEEISARFPFISLEKSIGRAQSLYEGDRSGKPMAIPTAFELWGYSPKSSGGFQTISALKSYGLLEDEGANEDRRVKLTGNARRYFLDERDDVRRAMLMDFAMEPALFKWLWIKDKWAEGIPADPVARSHLKIERSLNDQSARAALGIFKENLRFAGMAAGSGSREGLESSSNSRVDTTQSEKDVPIMERQEVAAKETLAKESAPSKPIVFDMETVTVAAQFQFAEDLQEFINKLEKLKPLMATKH